MIWIECVSRCVGRGFSLRVYLVIQRDFSHSFVNALNSSLSLYVRASWYTLLILWNYSLLASLLWYYEGIKRVMYLLLGERSPTEYSRLSEIQNILPPNVNVMTLTATATKTLRKEVSDMPPYSRCVLCMNKRTKTGCRDKKSRELINIPIQSSTIVTITH